jgi:apolipoprotein D and lipocalin family protein
MVFSIPQSATGREFELRSRRMSQASLLFFLAGILLCAGCTAMPPIRTEPSIDLDRFMGDWFVIANIPTFLEKDAYNAVESYRLDEKGVIQTTFQFNKGGFHGPLKIYHPKGFVRDKKTNAVWGMQFLWPIKAEYRIVYVSEDYGRTIIGRSKRDYVWIMARTPQISEEEYESLLKVVEEAGYDISRVQKVSQSVSPGGTYER